MASSGPEVSRLGPREDFPQASGSGLAMDSWRRSVRPAGADRCVPRPEALDRAKVSSGSLETLPMRLESLFNATNDQARTAVSLSGG